MGASWMNRSARYGVPIACVAGLILSGRAPAADPPPIDLITEEAIASIRDLLNAPVVRLSIAAKNERTGSLSQSDIDALDRQWRDEREKNDQPLITAVLSSPLSSYLTRIQAGSLGLYPEIFVMDAKGLNVGQSSVASDDWQGDVACTGQPDHQWRIGPSGRQRAQGVRPVDRRSRRPETVGAGISGKRSHGLIVTQPGARGPVPRGQPWGRSPAGRGLRGGNRVIAVSPPGGRV